MSRKSFGCVEFESLGIGVIINFFRLIIFPISMISHIYHIYDCVEKVGDSREDTRTKKFDILHIGISSVPVVFESI